MSGTVAETDRLRLRGWRRADRAEFVRVTNTPAVMRWLGGVADEATIEVALARLDGYGRDFGHTFWVVERRSDEALLGFCGLKRVNSPGCGDLAGATEIGWRLRQDAWGQGFAKEAAIASMDLAFERFSAPFVVALTVPGNLASQGLMKRLGMRRTPENDFVDDRFAHPGELNPSIVHRIEAGEWPAARAAALL